MSGRGVGAGSGASGKTFGQLEREVAELRRLVKELIQPKSRARVVNVGVGNLKFFKLREDAIGGAKTTVWAEDSNSTGSSLGGYTQVVSWNSLLADAQAGYWGLFGLVSGEWVFVQSDCITACGHDGTITVGTPPEGTVDAEYAGHTVTSSGTTGLAITGLPPGLTASGGVISGTPTEAGTFYAVATAEDGDCTITRIVLIVINPAEEEGGPEPDPEPDPGP
jgi:hypothetical protein